MTTRETRGGGDDAGLAAWVDGVVERARAVAARHHLPRDEANDLAQEAFQLLWRDRASGGWPPRAEKVDEVLETLARALARSGARPGQPWRKPPPAASTRDGPVLCPRLRALARHHRSPSLFTAILGLAAQHVAQGPGVLSAEQYRLFHLAHGALLDLEDLTARLRLANPRTTRRRLARISHKVERALLAALEPLLAARESNRLARLLATPAARRCESDATAVPEGLCDAVLDGLEAVIHKGPGPD